MSAPVEAHSSTPRSLESLPAELLELIVSYLPASDLKNLSLVSRCAYEHASAFLWSNVTLVDTRTSHPGPYSNTYEEDVESDEHDDTPIIQKLFVLARNPFIASQVHSITHRCHLPTPGIFKELPEMFFNSETVSRDWRTRQLLQLAIQNMKNVQTLRIIFGHYSLTKGLLEGFLDPDRPRNVPLRRLWLESCSIHDAQIYSLPTLNSCGLESVRFRRMRGEDATIQCTYKMGLPMFRPSRAAHSCYMHDGSGGMYMTTIEFDEDHRPSTAQAERTTKVEAWDNLIWHALPEIENFVLQTRPPPRVPRQAPQMPLAYILLASASTLTKINLDWVLWWREDMSVADKTAARDTIIGLSRLRFPHLRAFQVRNAVVRSTSLPEGLYLLEPGPGIFPTFLEFLEAHPKIQCLAWPMDRFFSNQIPDRDIRTRVRALVARFSGMLTDLRLDTYYDPQGEPLTDEGTMPLNVQARIRRRRFIAEFAPFMTKIEQLKMEGGIPRDEKRETIRALHHCPLQKIVLIGVSCPIGNTWGFMAKDLKEIDEGTHEFRGFLEEEDKSAIYASCRTIPSVPPHFEFAPSYGWPPSPPLIHTIAAHHASTITELKFCGYNGSPILTKSTPITKAFLDPLRHFHNLRQLVISMWLFTHYDFEDRDQEIIQSWLSARSPSSTALVVVTPAGSSSNTSPSPPHRTPAETVPPTLAPALHDMEPPGRPPEFNRWGVVLKTQYSPSALAYRVAADIGPRLSPIAKERRGGVRVRASFCLATDTGGDIFDLDLRVGRNNEVLEFVGPREEGEKNRWWDKLEGRRWF